MLRQQYLTLFILLGSGAPQISPRLGEIRLLQRDVMMRVEAIEEAIRPPDWRPSRYRDG